MGDISVLSTISPLGHGPSHILSRDRVEKGSVNVHIAELPATSVSLTTSPEETTLNIVHRFNDSLAAKDHHALVSLFIETGYWRDHLCLSYDLNTLKGRKAIWKRLESGHDVKKILIDDSTPVRCPQHTAIDGFGDVQGIQAYITVSTSTGCGRGVIRLILDGSTWRIFTIFSSLEGFNNHPELVRHHRSKGADHRGAADRKNWLENRVADMNFEDKDPVVLIIGAGQGGLTLAARLKMLNVDTLVIDTNKRIGDNWRKRYRQLVLHDPVWFDHMPYLPFPEFWPIFTPKDKLADFFEAYATLLELNVWTETSLESSRYNKEFGNWDIELEKRTSAGTVQIRKFTVSHLVLATGHSGKKNTPNILGMESFQGDRLCHSSEFAGATPALSNSKKAIVVGSCNSGHDIAQDFYEKGYDVTMVQRSSTCVISSNSIVDIGLKGLYSEGAPPTEDADLWFWSLPAEVLKAQQVKVTALQNQADQKMLQGLAGAGFVVDQGPNNAGLLFKYLQRGGGYYIDVGASQLIIDGKIKIKQGQEIRKILPRGLEFADGSTLEADEIVFATGYQNMKTQAGLIVGEDVASQIDDVWGFNDSGEIRTIWQKSGHSGFWFMGGNLAVSRYYSRILALQIKARVEGLVR